MIILYLFNNQVHHMTSGWQVRFVTSVVREVIFLKVAQSGKTEILLVIAKDMMLATMGNVKVALGAKHVHIASRNHTQFLLYLSQQSTCMKQMGPGRALLQHIQLSWRAHRWIARGIELFVPSLLVGIMYSQNMTSAWSPLKRSLWNIQLVLQWVGMLMGYLQLKSYIADIFSAQQCLSDHILLLKWENDISREASTWVSCRDIMHYMRSATI